MTAGALGARPNATRQLIALSDKLEIAFVYSTGNGAKHPAADFHVIRCGFRQHCIRDFACGQPARTLGCPKGGP